MIEPVLSPENDEQALLSQDALFLDQIEQYGRLVFSSIGSSMYPMLRGGRDVVVLSRVTKRLKRLDVALYRDDSGQYVLHRVVKVTDNGYLFCGDHCLAIDPPTPENRVLASVTCFYRGKWKISVRNPLYRLYAHVWCMSIKHRKAFIKYCAFLHRQIARLGRRKA